MRNIALLCLLVVISLSVCCKTCPPPVLVPVYKTCVLPGKVLVELPPATKAGCPDDMVCFEKAEFGKLSGTIERLVLWVKQARVSCGTLPSATQPSE